MIEIHNIEVFNLQGALRGMRFPMQSLDKADSDWRFDDAMEEMHFMLGERDFALARKLINAGSDHSKFMRQILVSMDITAPLYWWKEMDTYKVATVANSESTMHKLATTPITRECFSLDDLMNETGVSNLHEIWTMESDIITHCERLRQLYLETKDKRYWRRLIQILPSGWNQTRHWTGNYATLQKLVASRENHKLTEWHKFIATCNEQLPYFHELTKGE